MFVGSRDVDCTTSEEAAARASFLRMTPMKWRIVCCAEWVFRSLARFLPAPPKVAEAYRAPQSILVIEYWNLGDLVILLPFLRNLRQSFPGARISLLVNAGNATFLEGQGLVDEFIPVRVPWAQHFSRWKKYNPFSRSWISFARALTALRKKQFDWTFSGRMDLRDNFLMWLIRARRRIGYGVGGGGFLLTDRVVPDVSRPHRADVWLHLLSAAGATPARDTGGYQLSDAVHASAQAFLASRGIPRAASLIGIHPGARIATRRWGDERFVEVAQRILDETGMHVLWFSEPGNPSTEPLHPRCHPAALDFRSFLAVLARCRLLLCNDSGPMHLANLLNVPVVAIFGSTNPVWFGPRGAHDRVVIRPEFWCRPCFDYCIFEEPHCLRLISVEDVCQKVFPALHELTPRFEPGEAPPSGETIDRASGRIAHNPDERLARITTEAEKQEVSPGAPVVRRFRVLGVPIGAVQIPDVVTQMEAWIRGREGSHFIAVTNVHVLMEARHDADFKRLLESADLCVPDGSPLVWIGRWRGFPLKRRVYGPDLLLDFCRETNTRGYRHFFYGAAPGVPEALAEKLKRQFPGLEVAGAYSPSFGALTPEEDARIVEMINRSEADVLWVGLGCPKQERWMSEHRERLRVPVMVGVGQAFDIHSGRLNQAPAWIREHGLEWLYRLLREPRRLWRRYLIYNSEFIVAEFLEATGLKRFS